MLACGFFVASAADDQSFRNPVPMHALTSCYKKIAPAVANPDF